MIRRSCFLLVALAAMMTFALSGCGGDSEPGGEQSEGQAVYSANCARCHGPDGEGGVGPKLNDGAVVENYPDIEDQLALIREGRAGMPAFEDSLTPEEIQAVVDHTRDDLG